MACRADIFRACKWGLTFYPSPCDYRHKRTHQKIPVVRVVHSIQGEKKEKVKHDQKEESDEGHGEEERQMRRTVKIAVKLGEDKGDQEKELPTNALKKTISNQISKFRLNAEIWILTQMSL